MLETLEVLPFMPSKLVVLEDVVGGARVPFLSPAGMVTLVVDDSAVVLLYEGKLVEFGAR